MRFLLFFLFCASAVLVATEPRICPGVLNGTCGRSCQLFVCEQLTTLYNQTQGSARKGDTEPGWTLPTRIGWEAAAGDGCAAYLSLQNSSDKIHQPPKYCTDFAGVSCCRSGSSHTTTNSNAITNSTQSLPSNSSGCFFEYAMTDISLNINHINGSFQNGAIMEALLNLESCGLELLDFKQGRMSGSLTPQWGDMKHLRELHLTGNWISGTIPPELGNMASLEVLLLDNNFLVGTIPPELAKLKELRRLNLAAQGFTTINAESEPVKDAASLDGLGLTGTVPAGLFKLPNLSELNVEVNSLTGTLPDRLCNQDSWLQVLSVRRNALSGSAKGVEMCDNLVLLDLSMNSFIGALPASQHWSALSIYLASDNDFMGRIPEDLYRAPFLTWLDISNNSLDDSITDSIALMTYLQSFDAAHNRLTGAVPFGLFYLSALQTVDLSHNLLTGTLPWSIGLAGSLQTLQLSYNPLTGSIPDTMGMIGTLAQFSLLGTSMTAQKAIADKHNTSSVFNVEANATSNSTNATAPSSSSAASMLLAAGKAEWKAPRKLLAANQQRSAALAASIYSKFAGRYMAATGYAGQHRQLLLDQQQAAWRTAARWREQHHKLLQHFADPHFRQVLKDTVKHQHHRLLLQSSERDQTASSTATNSTQVAAAHAIVGSNLNSNDSIVEAEDYSTYGDNNLAANDYMPCWLALSDQNAPPPFDSSSLVLSVGNDSKVLSKLKSSAMTCPLIARRGVGVTYPWSGGEYAWLCKFEQPAAAEPSLNWRIDPAYYSYSGCICTQGYNMEDQFDTSIGLYRKYCVPKPPVGMPTWAAALVSVITPLLGLAISLLLLIFSNQAWQQIRFKPKYLRRIELNKRRAKGAPKPGAYASVVVTDIEGYSSLMAAEPHLTTAALGIHNNIIRKAQYCNAGVVLQQEGDSFSVAFHNPLDAVTFCLQVQIALQNTNWRLLSSTNIHKHTDSNHPRRAKSASARTAAAPAATTTPTASNTASSLTPAAQPVPSIMPQLVTAPSPDLATGAQVPLKQPDCAVMLANPVVAGCEGLRMPSSSSSTGVAPSQHSAPELTSSSQLQQLEQHHTMKAVQATDLALRHDLACTASDPVARRFSDGVLSLPDLGRRKQSSSSSGSTSSSSSFWRALWTRRPSKVSSSSIAEHSVGSASSRTHHFWQLLLPGSWSSATGGKHAHGSDGSSALFRGLQVRMGIARGRLPLDCENVENSWVTAKAQMISDMGAGGQVLMDAATFKSVKDACHELGCIDESGVNLSELEAAAWKTLLCPWKSYHAVSSTPEAVLLDMGAYKFKQHHDPQPNQPSTLAKSSTSSHCSGSSHSSGAADTRAARPLRWLGQLVCRNRSCRDASAQPKPSSTVANAVSVGSAKTLCTTAADVQQPQGSVEHGSANVLRVYQVLHPKLAGRAHVFGNDLQAKDIEAMADLPYFDAPGAMFADVSAAVTSSNAVALATAAHRLLNPLPSITMIFARVDCGKQLSAFNKTEGMEVNDIVVEVLMSGLKSVRGGYLCRVQEADMKYMVAFYDPQDALEWCLYVQELLMWQDWSSKVLALPSCKEVLDDISGLPLFRGPRLKMGLCEGSPRSIIPDHMGRADYHGAAINTAARYMEVAAHGGQIVCDLALAARVCRIWKGQQPPALQDVFSSSCFAQAAKATDAAGCLPYKCCYPATNMHPTPLGGNIEMQQNSGNARLASPLSVKPDGKVVPHKPDVDTVAHTDRNNATAELRDSTTAGDGGGIQQRDSGAVWAISSTGVATAVTTAPDATCNELSVSLKQPSQHENSHRVKSHDISVETSAGSSRSAGSSDRATRQASSTSQASNATYVTAVSCHDPGEHEAQGLHFGPCTDIKSSEKFQLAAAAHQHMRAQCDDELDSRRHIGSNGAGVGSTVDAQPRSGSPDSSSMAVLDAVSLLAIAASPARVFDGILAQSALRDPAVQDSIHRHQLNQSAEAEAVTTASRDTKVHGLKRGIKIKCGASADKVLKTLRQKSGFGLSKSFTSMTAIHREPASSSSSSSGWRQHQQQIQQTPLKASAEVGATEAECTAKPDMAAAPEQSAGSSSSSCCLCVCWQPDIELQDDAIHQQKGHDAGPTTCYSNSGSHILGSEIRQSRSVGNGTSSQQQQRTPLVGAVTTSSPMQGSATSATAPVAESASKVLSSQVRVPAVAVRRNMLQTSTEKFCLSCVYAKTLVEVHSIGVYKFKGCPDPVPMAAVSTQRLSARQYPDVAPAGKGARIPAAADPSVVIDSATVELPMLPTAAHAATTAWQQQQQSNTHEGSA